MNNVNPTLSLEDKYPDRHINIDQMYCYLKAKYTQENPSASQQEYREAIDAICKRIGY